MAKKRKPAQTEEADYDSREDYGSFRIANENDLFFAETTLKAWQGRLENRIQRAKEGGPRGYEIKDLEAEIARLRKGIGELRGTISRFKGRMRYSNKPPAADEKLRDWKEKSAGIQKEITQRTNRRRPR